MKMDPSKGIFDMIWMSLMATFQSNSVPFTAAQGNEEAVGYIIPMLLVTFLGFIVVSIVIGAVSNGLQNKIESLRKGRSHVIEKNHFIILGWSEQIFTIITELVNHAKEIHEKHCVVIMGDKDKVEMEDEIKGKVGQTGNVRVVCRTGNPIELADLEIVNLNHSETILLLFQIKIRILILRLLKLYLQLSEIRTGERNHIKLLPKCRMMKKPD